MEPFLRPVPRERDSFVTPVEAGKIAADENIRFAAIHTVGADARMRHILAVGPARCWIDAKAGGAGLHIVVSLMIADCEDDAYR
ncbi:hypothetical protein BTHE68_61300 (plasmid) [Burkholderia sp. THE68]|nr:hypothetical protein BTHE68_61300 [Burkholderia sp. THE68]BCQ27127.1 hypothetical protein NK8_53160 [Caballeronia sp. NK8]